MSFPKEKIGERVFATLRNRIIRLEYQADTILAEKDLEDEFKVSRAPIREAIRRLEEMNLVRSIPRYGTVIRPVDMTEIRCAFEVRKKLECLAGSLAARRITPEKLKKMAEMVDLADGYLKDDDFKGVFNEKLDLDFNFHITIYQASQNPLLEEILKDLYFRCARVLGIMPDSKFFVNYETVGQLRDIHQALAERNEDQAAALLENHIQYFIDGIRNDLL